MHSSASTLYLSVYNLRSVLKCKFIEGVVCPLVSEGTDQESGSSLQDKFKDLFEGLCMCVLEHRGDNSLFERGKVSSHLSINLVVLLPKLYSLFVKLMKQERMVNIL